MKIFFLVVEVLDFYFNFILAAVVIKGNFTAEIKAFHKLDLSYIGHKMLSWKHIFRSPLS